jgi:hypothetical protein
MNPSDYALFYSTATLQVYTGDQMLILFGINIQTVSIEVLNYQSFYPVVETPITADTGLYTAAPTYTVNGDIADQTWTYTARSLPIAKNYASAEVSNSSNTQASNLVANSGVNVNIWTGAASQAVIDRPPLYTTLLDEMTVIGDNLAAQLAAIDAATTVDEVNNVVNPPYGVISTSRTGNDFNDSYYVTFYSTSLINDDTELFIPGTSTVIPYILPTQFNGTSEAFNTGDYLVQIREASTGLVLADFICPEGPPAVEVSY